MDFDSESGDESGTCEDPNNNLGFCSYDPNNRRFGRGDDRFAAGFDFGNRYESNSMRAGGWFLFDGDVGDGMKGDGYT